MLARKLVLLLQMLWGRRVKNETKKNIVIAVAIFFCGVFCTLGAILPFYNYRIRRANSELDKLTIRLAESERDLSVAATTIANCTDAAERISKSVSTSTTELGTIIQNLRQIREAVRDMEETLYRFNNSSGDNDSNDSTVN